MKINCDFSDLLRALSDGGVRFLVVGGYAVMRYTEPRFTKDLDVWVDPEPGNAARVFAALTDFGAPLTDLTPDSFTDATMVYQIGVAPVRVDILMAISGLNFEAAWKNRQEAQLGSEQVPVLSRDDLITSKRASGRPSDRADLKRLLRTQSKLAWRPPGKTGR